MTEQTNTVSEEEKAAAAKQDAETRRLVGIQIDETAKRETDHAWKNLGSIPNHEARALVIKQCGFDPGW